MSIDYQLAHRCPHLIQEESVALGTDRQSLEARAPVASTTILRVMANNAYVPAGGLHSQATLYGSQSGPFNISGCETEAGVSVTGANVVTITGSGETHTFTLPIGPRITTDSLVRVFRESFVDLYVSNENGYLVFVDAATIGKSSRVTLSGRGASSIGFTQQRSTRGRELIPPWKLVTRTDVLPAVNRNNQLITTARYVRFTKSVRSNPTFKVTYVAPPERCPRCRGSHIENDWRFTVDGELLAVQNENLLYQAALKMLLTRRGSNPYHRAYGSSLITRVGKKAVGATVQQLHEDVQTALSRVQSLQSQQGKYQKVSLKERLYAVKSVQVKRHNQDPTVFLIDVVVSNGTNTPVSLSVVFSVPGAIALAGTNNMSLGLDASGLTAAESRRLLSG